MLNPIAWMRGRKGPEAPWGVIIEAPQGEKPVLAMTLKEMREQREALILKIDSGAANACALERLSLINQTLATAEYLKGGGWGPATRRPE